MQKGPLRAIARVIFWRFRRGSWQYDIMCGVILLFIFLTPRSVFDGSFFSETDEREVTQDSEKEAVEEKSVDSETLIERVEEAEAQLNVSD
jgi:hypothetical protein